MNLARYRFVLSRPLQLLPVLFGISLITFVLVRSIPGDPARTSTATDDDPASLAMRSLGGELVARQHEMRLAL